MVQLGTSRDWQGYMVECRASVKLRAQADEVGSMVVRTGAALVLTEISNEYYDYVTGDEFKAKMAQSGQ